MLYIFHYVGFSLCRRELWTGSIQIICVKCSGSVWNWVAYILLLFVPPTILFVVLLIINVNSHSLHSSKLIRCFGLRKWHAVRTFLEVFVGSYKDGTNASEGKRDYRLTAELYLIGRILTSVGWTKRAVSTQTSQQYNWMIAAVATIPCSSSGFCIHQTPPQVVSQSCHCPAMSSNVKDVCLLAHYLRNNYK